MAKSVEIPFSYGDVIAVTGSGMKVVMWLKDPTGVIRGLLVDVSDPTAPKLAKDEVVIRRKTEGQVRRKKKMPPIGAAQAKPASS